MSKKKPAQEVPQREGPGLVEQLRDAIRQSGQALNQLSKTCGVARSTLSRFMRGKQDLGLTAAEKICDALGLNLTGGRSPPGEKGKAGKGGKK